ncbi:MAG: hypothetical protein Q8L87_18975 [Anaerolineales bacterium]|jgi:hypothetical protein|nr:hypothetical protein [Anaerolineales bacterium]
MADLSLLKEFFRTPSVNDKLNLFQVLLAAQEINVDIALAMLKVIHKELSLERVSDCSAYKRYAEVVEALRYHQSDVLREVVNAWNADRIAKDPEWLSDGVVK